MDDFEQNGPQVIEVVMPTYTLEPTEHESFRRKKVCVIVKEVLEQVLEGKEYDEDDAKDWSVEISDKVKSRVKKEGHFPRYKLVVQAVVGQQKQQDVRIASRCLWSDEHDNHASGQYNNHSLWGTCMVFGLYAD